VSTVPIANCLATGQRPSWVTSARGAQGSAHSYYGRIVPYPDASLRRGLGGVQHYNQQEGLGPVWRPQNGMSFILRN